MKRKRKDEGISEILGTVLLLGISIALFSVLYLMLQNVLVAEHTPVADLIGYIDGDTIFIEHHGGNSLPGSIVITVSVGGTDHVIDFDDSFDRNNNGYWDIGEQVYFSSPQMEEPVAVVVSVVDVARNKLLYLGRLKDGAIDEQDNGDIPSIVYVSKEYDESTNGWGYDHFDDLQEGIDSVADSGIVYLKNGVYYGNYIISKPLSLIGESKDLTIIDAEGSNATTDGYVLIDSTMNVLLRSFTVRNGFIPPEEEEDEDDDDIYALIMTRESSNIVLTDIILHDSNAGYASVEDNLDITADNLTIYNCNIGTGIKDGKTALFSHNQIFDCIIGFFMTETISSNVIVEHNIINNTMAGMYFVKSNDTIIRSNIIRHSSIFGILFDPETESFNNLIYNNQFLNNSFHVRDDYANYYNITRTLGTNIIGGPYIGGNYWDDYTGIDTENDGLGNTELPYNSSGTIVHGGDYHPLTEQSFLPVSLWKFDENSGCIAKDSYGGNDGVLSPDCPNNAPLWIEGKLNSSLFFDGIDDFVFVNNAPNLNPRSAITISAWIKWSIDPATGESWAAIVNKNGDSQYRLQHNQDNSRFEFALRTTRGSRWVHSDTVPIENVWYYVVGTYDGEAIKIYVNGSLENSVSWSGNILESTSPLLIGRHSNTGRNFNGTIDEVGLYDRALTDQEIASLYEYYELLSEDAKETDDIISSWRFDENSGTTAFDSIGENHGTIHGATWTTGKQGSALSFDANQNSIVTIPYDDSIVLDHNFTVSFWIQPTPNTVFWRTFLTRSGQFTCSFIGGNKIRVHINGYTNIDSQSTAPRNSWTHVVFTLVDSDRGNDIIRLYINGELDGQIGPVWGTPQTPSNPLFIGGSGSGSYYTGKLDEIIIYNRALSSEEVSSLFNQYN